ncbi:MAG: glycosyltransferase 87 family protein [Candidatus Pacebacteria bacterium]|nr:glycosyltransferase 87 family protein [Candidatus Paceibacterota bacterium]
MENRRVNYFLYLTAAVAAVSAFFHGLFFAKILPWNIVYSDIVGFYQKAISAFSFAQIQIEYPALTSFFIRLTGTIGGSQFGYYLANSAFLILCAAAATYFLYKIASDKKKLLNYWIFAPSMFVFAVFNWDLLAVLSVAAALYFASKEKYYLAAVFIAFGFAAKLYPVLYLIPVLLKQKNWKEWLKITGIFLGVIILINIYFIASNFDSWLYFFELNSLRNSNPDSIWTIVRFFFRNLSVSGINVISFLLFGSSYAYLMYKYRRASVLVLCFISTVLFLLFNKVFSPQYALWILPFLAILPFQKIKGWFYAFEFSNLAILFIILPWFLIEKNIIYFYWVAPFVLARHAILTVYLLKAVKLAKTEKIS